MQIDSLDKFIQVVNIIYKARGLKGTYEWLEVNVPVPVQFKEQEQSEEHLLKYAKYCYTWNFDLSNFSVKDVC